MAMGLQSRGRGILLCVVLLGLCAGALAQPQFDEGLAAARRGDNAEAYRLWLPLAEKGHSNAQNNLGVLYERGRGVPQNEKTAASWYRRAAEGGNPMAMNNLGVLYGSGRGVSPDVVQANFWFTLSAAAGNANGATNRDSTSRRLTQAQREQVEKLLSEWRAAHSR